jgi:hypothetical protein
LPALASLFLIHGGNARAADEVALIDPDKPLDGWRFDNGPEFPGAKGGMAVDGDVEAQHRPALRLDGDFTGGGNYVQTGRDLPTVDVETLTFWLKAPQGLEQITLRLIDGTGQCHQFNLRVEAHGNWQRILFPVARYFEKAGTSSSVELVKRYEGWGGAKDGKWHNPAKSLYILVGRTAFGEAKKGSLWISGAKLQAAPPKTILTKEVRLDDVLREGELDWSFNDGREFPGAKGSVGLVKDIPEAGVIAVKLQGDFTGGGAYVSTDHRLGGLDVKAIRMRVLTSNVKSLNVRLGDGSGQCHQAKGFTLTPDGQWHDVVIETAAVVGGEHWGGANDGTWHGNGQYISLLLGKGSAEDLKPELLITDIRADVEVSAAVAGEAYKESFDAAETLPVGWTATGPAGTTGLVGDAPFDGTRALRVQRTETQLNDDVSVTGVSFAAAPGPWSVGGSLRSALHSPDNSFAVRLNLEALDGAGGVLERATLVDQTGQQNWTPFAKQLDLPNGTAKARFTVTVHKTHGTCDVDALTAVPLEVRGEEQLVERIVISSGVVGNLFLPEDELAFKLDVQCERPLPAGERRALVTVTDYWGAEQFPAQEVALERSGLVEQRFRYLGTVAVPKATLAVGKYYELHVSIPLTGYEDGAEYSGFARLPVAESKQYPANQIPFTIRNWDSRIPDYHKLASRIGHRQIGTWGDSGWERIRDLGDTWYGGPAGVNQVERGGWKDITEEKLRQNAVDFMTKHKDTASLACIMLGNEPNERHELVAEKVRAYQIAYEALKSVKPDVKIVTTSVPPLESFFAAGYHKYTDVYDFHVYETYENVRQAIRRYRDLGKKYGAEKPIWCTELGLNSQGQTRYAVAQEVVKKITAFFAEGGENVSWFTIMYPDPNGKARGTSGDAHNTFDCQYSQYNPRIDAIMYYTMINGVTVKRIFDEVQHANGVQAYLFRDGDDNCLQVLWHENGRVDCGIPLEGVGEARLIRIDGSSVALTPRDGVVSVGVSGEPVLLRYKQPATKLARELPAPALSVPEQALAVLKGKGRELRVTGPGLTAGELMVDVPPRWTAATRQDGADAVVCTVTAPAETDARTGRVMLQRKGAKDAACGEIILPLPIMSPISIEVSAAARNADGEPGVRVRLQNNGSEAKPVTWTVELADAWSMNKGVFQLSAPEPVPAYLKGENEGQATLAAGAVRDLRVNVTDATPQTLYRVRVNVTDDVGRRVSRERLVGGFATAARAAQPVAIDGRLDEAVWTKAPVERIDGAAAVYRFGNATPWRDAADQSCAWRAAWDDQYLYLGLEVTDDVHHVQFADGAIWNQDGLQFLFDPTRTLAEKAGKYDYSVGVGTKGPQAWCHLAAHSSVAEGEAKDFKVAATDLPGSAGGKVYEIAIPWTRLAPFVPAVGANLGMNMILNEDDGPGRIGFMGWFSGAHSKELDQVGDVVLGE